MKTKILTKYKLIEIIDEAINGLTLERNSGYPEDYEEYEKQIAEYKRIKRELRKINAVQNCIQLSKNKDYILFQTKLEY